MELNKDNYYSLESNQEYMSYSQFKDFNKCPAMAMAKINGTYEEEMTDSLLVGSYVDAYLDGEIIKFAQEYPQIFNSRNGELKAPFKLADDLCIRIEEDEYLYGLLKGDRQTIITGQIAGVKFKGKIDSLLADCIVDGKVLKDCEDVYKNGEKMPFYKANGYDIQGAIYTTLYRQMTGKNLPFRLAVITKEKTPDKRVFEFSEQTLDDALQEIIAKAPIYDAIKKGLEPIYRCECCDYCKSSKHLSKYDIEYL